MRIHGRKIPDEFLHEVEARILRQRSWFDSEYIASNLDTLPGGLTGVQKALWLDPHNTIEDMYCPLYSIVRSILKKLRKAGLVEFDRNAKGWMVVR